MRAAHLAELLGLAAIWGSSFLFMRLAAPAFGPVALAFIRVLGAAAPVPAGHTGEPLAG